jgi:hypothetical protein
MIWPITIGPAEIPEIRRFDILTDIAGFPTLRRFLHWSSLATE